MIPFAHNAALGPPPISPRPRKPLKSGKWSQFRFGSVWWHLICLGRRVRRCLWFVIVVVAVLFQVQAAPPTVAETPFQFREGLLWVAVSVPQSKETLHFLVDSGASVSVLNLSTAKRLGIHLGPKVNVTAVGSKLTGHWPVKLAVAAGQIQFPEEFLALDLGKLSGACRRSVDG